MKPNLTMKVKRIWQAVAYLAIFSLMLSTAQAGAAKLASTTDLAGDSGVQVLPEPEASYTTIDYPGVNNSAGGSTDHHHEEARASGNAGTAQDKTNAIGLILGAIDDRTR